MNKANSQIDNVVDDSCAHKCKYGQYQGCNVPVRQVHGLQPELQVRYDHDSPDEQRAEAGERRRLAAIEDHIVEREDAVGEVEDYDRMVDAEYRPHEEIGPVQLLVVRVLFVQFWVSNEG